MISKNPIMQSLKKMSREQRVGLIIGGIVVSFGLILLMQITRFLLSPFWLFIFMLVEWLCSNIILYSAISLKSSWKNSTHNLLGWSWTVLASLALVLLFIQSSISLSLLKEHPNLIMSGSPKDKSCTLYFYETQGDFWKGKDIDVTLEMTAEPGKETFVCHLEQTRNLNLFWKSTTSFSLNGKIYVIEDGKAVPLKSHSK